MAITFSTINIDFEVAQPIRVKKWIKNIVESNGKSVGDIGYLFCDDEYLLQVNQQYLNHDTLTDIITFDYARGQLLSGDILISVDRVGENAQIFQVPFEQELHRVIIHGVLHLLGQGDKSEEEAAEMRRREEAALALWETID